MKNRWNDSSARRLASKSANRQLALCVYSSNLLGQEADLVLHGGGNTSVKGQLADVFGETRRVLFVKGSGCDLRAIQEADFAPVELDYLLRLGELEQLSDSAMMRQLRLALLDPAARTPSVEAILHALIPHRHVYHSHADAVVAISNSSGGDKALEEIYGDRVLILPYVMPGFILARQVAETTRGFDWSRIEGIVLLHHGIFTFHDEARDAYGNMIDLVSRAEGWLRRRSSAMVTATSRPDREDCLRLSALRQAAGALFGAPVLACLDSSPPAAGFAGLPNAVELATRGPLTPDHTIHTKPFAAGFDDDPLPGLARFEADYRAYFADHSEAHHQCLDCMPRFGVWRGRGMVYLAANRQRLGIARDIGTHTIAAIQQAEALGGWQALPAKDLFEVEYWELEQAKLKSTVARARFEGKVVVVTGAASGIGRACVDTLTQQGAVAVALDVAEDFAGSFDDPAVLPLRCDVRDAEAVAEALHQGVCTFGGIDVLVSNAGNFPASCSIEDLEDGDWNRSIELNLSSHMKVMRACAPFLKQGFDPAMVIVASKNVPAPGPGAAAYSAAKAGLTQLARVAALEFGSAGIRVNAVHPDKVYDTGIWTREVIEQRAAAWGMTVAEYCTANVLGAEVAATDVARAVAVLADQTLSRTTGAQLPVDGGNERVI